jgi:hypothetical protein
MKNKFITTGLIFSFLFFLPFSSQVSAESFGDLYNQKERVASLKETATHLLLVVENDEEKEDIKVALQQIISTAESIESRVEEEIEEDFSAYSEILESFDNMQNLDSLIFGGNLYIEGASYLDEVEGVADVEWEVGLDANNESAELLLGINLYAEELSLEESVDLSISGEVLAVDESIFGKLNQLSLSTNTEDPIMLGFVDMAEAVMEEVEGKYVFLSENIEEDLEREISGYEYYYYLGDNTEETSDFLIDLFRDNILEITKTERDYVDGELNNKHTIVINEEMIEEHGYGEVDTDNPIEISLQVWSDGDYITKTELSLSGEGVEGWVSLNFHLYFSDFNEYLNITAPRSYINFEDLDIFKNTDQYYDNYGAYDIAIDADKKAMIRQARSFSEVYYGDNDWSYSGVGEKLREVIGNFDFEDETEYNTTDDGYCIEVELSSGSYYCTDNNLDLVENTTRKCTPSSVSCY